MSSAKTVTTVEELEEVHQRFLSIRLTASDGGLTQLRKPLTYGGSLDKYKSSELTTALGRQYEEDFQLVDFLNADDATLRDLAYTVSSRGVLLLKNQSINGEKMQEFIRRFSQVAGAPPSSGLHIHPSLNVNGSGNEGLKIQAISSEAQKKAGGHFWRNNGREFLASEGWHSDVSWEKAPADYSMLKLIQLPSVGGDTHFASGEELYNRLSPSFAAYLETLEAVHSGETFIDEVKRNGGALYQGERGSPFNKNQDLQAIHPVVRTNPVTGRKAIFVNVNFTKSIVGVTRFESKAILDFLFNLLSQNFDLQARIKWSLNDLALWDNRCTFHSASFDFEGPRLGHRACSVGEVPFFSQSGYDPKA